MKRKRPELKVSPLERAENSSANAFASNFRNADRLFRFGPLSLPGALPQSKKDLHLTE